MCKQTQTRAELRAANLALTVLIAKQTLDNPHIMFSASVGSEGLGTAEGHAAYVAFVRPHACLLQADHDLGTSVTTGFNKVHTSDGLPELIWTSLNPYHPLPGASSGIGQVRTFSRHGPQTLQIFDDH